jgi:hypothetical protein
MERKDGIWHYQARPASDRPVFDFRAHPCHSVPMETHAFGFRLPANAPEGQKRSPISTRSDETSSGAVATYFLLSDEWNRDPLCRIANLRVHEATVAREEKQVDISYGDWLSRPSLIWLQHVIIAEKG